MDACGHLALVEAVAHDARDMLDDLPHRLVNHRERRVHDVGEVEVVEAGEADVCGGGEAALVQRFDCAERRVIVAGEERRDMTGIEQGTRGLVAGEPARAADADVLLLNSDSRPPIMVLEKTLPVSATRMPMARLRYLMRARPKMLGW